MKLDDYRMFNISFRAIYRGKVREFTAARHLLLAGPERIPDAEDIDVRLVAVNHCEKVGAILCSIDRITECSDYRASF